MSIINIQNIQNILHQNKNFDELKTLLLSNQIDVRESIESDLFLLITNKNVTEYNSLQEECNGLILEKNTNNIVCMCQNKFKIINNQNQHNIIESFQDKNIKMEYCEDGTVIKLYNYNDIWYTATTKCIDAKNSYWNSDKTFDTMFWEIFNNRNYDLNTLNKNETYIFILIHVENRIVVKHNYNKLIFISSINNSSLEEIYTSDLVDYKFIDYITPIEQPLICNDVCPLDEHYFNNTKRGVIFKLFDNNTVIIYQYDFQMYTYLKDIRGNVPLIHYRYLELLHEPNKLEVLKQCYNEHKYRFVMVEHCLNNLYKEIHNLYFQSHIKHSIKIDETNKFYRTLKQLHAIFKQHKKIITLDEVKNKVNSLDKNVLIKLLDWK